MTAQLLKPPGSLFYFYKDRIEKDIAKSISSFGEKNKLRDACEYALTSGGKRIRPLIVHMIADALGHGLDVSEAALAVEFSHTASLIADDLPCMDDEEERRGKPTVHKVFGETVAYLASYALFNAAYEQIYKNAQVMKEAMPPFNASAEKVCMLVLQCSSQCAGILGATGGQFMDLFPPQHNLETVKQTILKKTVTLFETAFVGGWLFGGGEIGRLPAVKKAAFHLGMAFQIADDLADNAQDEKNEGESNISHLLGKERAVLLFHDEMCKLKEYLKELELETPSFEKLCDMLTKSALC